MANEKKSNNDRITLRLDPHLLKDLEKIAKEDNRKVNNLVVHVLTRYRDAAKEDPQFKAIFDDSNKRSV